MLYPLAGGGAPMLGTATATTGDVQTWTTTLSTMVGGRQVTPPGLRRLPLRGRWTRVRGGQLGSGTL